MNCTAKKRSLLLGVFCIITLVVSCMAFGECCYAKEKTYTVKNLDSFVSTLEKMPSSGGNIVVKKGTYNVDKTLFVPSNVTITLEKGVTMNAKTGVVFALVPSAEVQTPQKKYNAAQNIKIIGKGATINLDNTGATAVFAAHNQKVSIEGITFKTHATNTDVVRIMSSNNVTIKKCTFSGKNRKSVAIKLEVACSKKTPLRKWIQNDNTINKKITIQSCKFKNVDRGVATVRYTEKKIDDTISIEKCTFENIGSDAIRGLNWKNVTITENTFKKIGEGSKIKGKTGIRQAIFLSGVKKVDITSNTFTEVPIPIKFAVFQNTEPEIKDFAMIKCTLTAKELKAMQQKNSVKNCGEYRIRWYKKNGNDFEEYYFKDDQTTYTVTPKSSTYRNAYIKSLGYNNNTKHFYMFRSYMDQIERNGGGTLIVKKGTYQITNEIPVPSNTTVILEDGVIIKKIGNTGSTAIKANKGIFALVDPSKMTDSSFKGYTKYNGVHDVVIKGPKKGTAILDSNYQEGVQAVLLCFNKNVTIENLTFRNMNEGHFIELDASNKIVIQNNIFMNAKRPSDNLDKCFREAINLDIPDEKTGGIWRQWIKKYDKTPNNDILIQNNTFKNLNRAIGSHNFTPGSAHKNVKIVNNTIDKTLNDAIRLINYENLTITGNKISNVKGDNTESGSIKRGIFLSGIKDATIKGNTFKNMARPIQINVYQYSDKKPYADIISNKLTAQNKKDMLDNKLINVGENFIRYSNKLSESTQEKWEFE